VEDAARPGVVADEHRQRDEAREPRFRELEEIAEAADPGRHPCEKDVGSGFSRRQLGHAAALSISGSVSSGASGSRRARKAESVTRSDVTSVAAPVATWAVVISTARP